MKQWFVLVFSILALWSVSALEVDRGELRVDPSIRIEFENFEGPPGKVETADQIRGIGAVMAEAPGAEGRYFGSYRIVRAVDPSVSEGLDADILILERSAQVDHIRNLRLIIAGYLGGAYGYSSRDSYLLAEFITIYNAVYRKNLEYFTSRFKRLVLSHLERDKAGLALSYREWPGATQIVIPLSDAAKGSLGAVDTGAVTERAVVADLQSREDRGVEIRKEMVDLKERQIIEEERKVEEAKRAHQDEQERLEEQERKVQEDLSRIEEEKKTLAGKPAEEAAAARERIDREQERLRAEQARVAEERQTALEREKEIRDREERIEEKKEEVREDRREIAADQQAVLSRESTGAVAGIPFIKTEAGTFGRMVLIDPKTGEILSVSPEAPLAVRGFEPFGGGLAVILLRTGPAGRLAILETSTLKEKIAAREEIFPKTLFRVNGGELFVVIRDSGKWYLGKYDSALALLARSRVEVNPETFILFSDAHVFVEGSDGRIVPLFLRNMQ